MSDFEKGINQQLFDFNLSVNQKVGSIHESIPHSKEDYLRDLRKRVDITVRTLDELFSLPTFKRKWYLRVGVYDDGSNNGTYVLVRGESSNDLRDNSNWVKKDFYWKYYQNTTPNPNKAKEKDIWFRPIDAKLFELVVVNGSNYWIESTSPPTEVYQLLMKPIVTETDSHYFITEDEKYYIQQEIQWT